MVNVLASTLPPQKKPSKNVPHPIPRLSSELVEVEDALDHKRLLWSSWPVAGSARGIGPRDAWLVSAFVLLSYCCLNKFPQMQWLKTTEIYYFCSSVGQNSNMALTRLTSGRLQNCTFFRSFEGRHIRVVGRIQVFGVAGPRPLFPSCVLPRLRLTFWSCPHWLLPPSSIFKSRSGRWRPSHTWNLPYPCPCKCHGQARVVSLASGPFAMWCDVHGVAPGAKVLPASPDWSPWRLERLWCPPLKPGKVACFKGQRF